MNIETGVSFEQLRGWLADPTFRALWPHAPLFTAAAERWDLTHAEAELCRIVAVICHADNVGTLAAYRAQRQSPDPPTMPPAKTQLWNFLAAVAAFVTAPGLVDATEYRRRLGICDGCKNRVGRRCLACGCFIAVKARATAWHCPAGKWDPPANLNH